MVDDELIALVKSKEFKREDLEEVLTYIKKESDTLLSLYYKRSYKSLRIEFIWDLYKIIFEELEYRNLAIMKKELKEIVYADLFTSEDYMEEMENNWYDSVYATLSHMLFLERTLTILLKEMDNNCKFEESILFYRSNSNTKFGKIRVYNEEIDK